MSKLENKESKNYLENLKSDYFLQLIFSYFETDKSLNIVKNNKQIQKRLNLSIKDYKAFSETSPIEIEIIPNNERISKFINIVDKIDYYHIYFNDDKTEIKIKELKEDEKVSKIKVILDYQIKSFKGLFSFCQDIKSINFKKFYRNNITNMNQMFYKCDSLQEINFNNFFSR